jgi:hypothetical protein
VTIAQGKERHHTTKEMVETGMGRGFTGLTDDAPPAEFSRVMSRQRIAYAPDHACAVVKEGIQRCLSRKDKSRFTNFILAIQAPLLILPRDRWAAIKRDLRASAKPRPFKEVYVVSNASDKPWGFQIK